MEGQKVKRKKPREVQQLLEMEQKMKKKAEWLAMQKLQLDAEVDWENLRVSCNNRTGLLQVQANQKEKILCDCCSELFVPSYWEIHCESKKKNPTMSIVAVDSGMTLLELRRIRKLQEKEITNANPEVKKSSPNAGQAIAKEAEASRIAELSKQVAELELQLKQCVIQNDMLTFTVGVLQKELESCRTEKQEMEVKLSKLTAKQSQSEEFELLQEMFSGLNLSVVREVWQRSKNMNQAVEELLQMHEEKQQLEASLDEERQKLKRLQEEVEVLKEQNACVVCMDATISISFGPCRHACACVECSKKLSECPICRKPISRRFMIRIQ